MPYFNFQRPTSWCIRSMFRWLYVFCRISWNLNWHLQDIVICDDVEINGYEVIGRICDWFGGSVLCVCGWSCAWPGTTLQREFLRRYDVMFVTILCPIESVDTLVTFVMQLCNFKMISTTTGSWIRSRGDADRIQLPVVVEIISKFAKLHDKGVEGVHTLDGAECIAVSRFSSFKQKI